MKKIISKITPTFVALVLFFAVTAACFAPQFEGKVLQQHDIEQFNGMSRDIREHRNLTGEDPQWTGAMFGGMPAYQINIRYPAQIIKSAGDWLFGLVGEPSSMLFFAMVAAFAMVVMMGYSPWIGLITGLAYGLSTYFFLIIGAGHITKMWALVFAPAMMGAIYMTLRGRALLGGALAALFGALEIGANHPQITYYFLLAALALWISDAIFAIKESKLKEWGRRTAILFAAALLAIGANFAPLYYTAQHTADTTRGGSEVAIEAGADKGLDLEYATAWSYGVSESWNMLIPNFMGGDSATSFSANGAVANTFKEIGFDRRVATQLPTYWGDQPYTAGPTYLGAVVVFLALLGLLLAPSRDRWWILAATLLAILLAWGSNAMWFTEFCFNFLPLYNKFRTVSMALVVVEWSVPMLAAIALWQLYRRWDERKALTRAIAIAAGVTAGVCMLFAVAGDSLLDFGREQGGEMMSRQFRYVLQQEQEGQALIASGLHDEWGYMVADAMAVERAEILAADAWRSCLFIVAAALLAIGALRIGKRWRLGALALLAALILADILPVNLRYLSHDDFVAKRTTTITPTEADRLIMADKEPGYRVFNLSVSPFNDATTSMFHRSVGGYHGAKMGRYQDLIDRYLTSGNEAVLDMLNTKYIITREGDVAERTTSLGAAWLVDTVLPVRNATEELDALGIVDLATTAVVNEGETLPAQSFASDGSIELVEYHPNLLRYRYQSDSEAFAVFSEIFYDKGWEAYIDGERADYVRTNFLLRGMVLPTGEHTIEWRFRAPNWSAVEAVTLICSIAILGGLLLILIFGKRYEKQSNNEA